MQTKHRQSNLSPLRLRDVAHLPTFTPCSYLACAKASNLACHSLGAHTHTHAHKRACDRIPLRSTHRTRAILQAFVIVITFLTPTIPHVITLCILAYFYRLEYNTPYSHRPACFCVQKEASCRLSWKDNDSGNAQDKFQTKHAHSRWAE